MDRATRILNAKADRAAWTRRQFVAGMGAGAIVAAGMRVRKASALLGLPGGAEGAGGTGSGFAPNRPAGSSTIIDRQWNPTDPTLGTLPPPGLTGTDSYDMTWYPGSPSTAPYIDTIANLSTITGQSIPALPDGNATAMCVYWPSGFPAGNIPFGCYYAGNFAVKTLYFCFYIYLGTFNANSNNIKWVIITKGTPTNYGNHVLELYSGGDKRLNWLAEQFNSGTPSGDIYYGGGYSTPGNPSNPPGAIVGPLSQTPSDVPGYGYGSQLTHWLMCEALFTAESVPGTSSDGVYKSWVNSTLINYWANVNYNSQGSGVTTLNGCSYEPYYGGGGTAAPANEYVMMGRFLCAGA